MTPGTLRVGIVGAGGIVKARHLPALRRRTDVEVRAVSNSSRASAEAVAAEYGIPDVHDDWRELVARDDLDVVWIGTPPALHAPVTIAALEAGKHVFCQARMATDLAEARRMLAAAQARPELVTMLCPPPHGMRHGEHLRVLLAEGYLGEPVQFRLQVLANQWTDPSRSLHFRQSAELSGDNILSVGIFLEVLDAWLGRPERIGAQLATAVREQGGAAVTVPDIVQVFGLWPGGLPGTAEWSGVAMHPPEERLEIYGREGTLVYRFADDAILGARRGEGELRPLAVPPEHVREWTVEDDFIEAVRVGGHPEPSFETGLDYMIGLDALRRSAREGRVVDIVAEYGML